MATAWMDPSGCIEHMVVVRSARRKSSTSPGLILTALRWLTPMTEQTSGPPAPAGPDGGPAARLATRHGIADQEAAQADAEEEAQEDAEGDALAAPGRAVASAGRTPHDPAVPREGAPNKPGRPAARQRGLFSRGLAEAVAPGGQAGLNRQGGGLQVVGAVGSAAPAVPRLVHQRGRHSKRRGEQGVPLAARPVERQRLDLLTHSSDPGPAPIRQNGTSAPSRAATSDRSPPAQRNTAAASAEPRRDRPRPGPFVEAYERPPGGGREGPSHQVVVTVGRDLETETLARHPSRDLQAVPRGENLQAGRTGRERPSRHRAGGSRRPARR